MWNWNPTAPTEADLLRAERDKLKRDYDAAKDEVQLEKARSDRLITALHAAEAKATDYERQLERLEARYDKFVDRLTDRAIPPIRPPTVIKARTPEERMDEKILEQYRAEAGYMLTEQEIAADLERIRAEADGTRRE